jgi:alpha-1,2-mannosyltransferase
VAFIAVVLLVLLVQVLRKAYRVGGYDLTSYLLSAQALLDGRNPYTVDTPFPYIYPLFLAFVLVPLTLVPYWVANVIWFILSVTALMVSCAVCVKAAGSEVKTHVGWHLALPGLLIFLVAFSPIQNNLLNGQVNFIVVMCCVMFFDCFTRKQTEVGAAWLGVAIALKLLPAILIGFLVVRREFRFAVLAVAFAVVFCLLPGLTAGELLRPYYVTYLKTFLFGGLATLGGGTASGFNLQSALGFFYPWCGHSVWVRLVSLLVSGVMVLAVDLAVIRSPHPQRHVWGFCAYLIGCLFLSPLGETHHLAFALPALLLVGMKAVFDDDWAATAVKPMVLGFAACFVGLPLVLDPKPAYFVSLSLLTALLFLAAGRCTSSGSQRVLHTTDS